MKDRTTTRLIIVHCTATPEGRDVHVADVRKWHKQRGWEDIGYHYLIALDGTIECGRGESKIGAHCSGRNAISIGVCYVGGIDKNTLKAKDTRTPAQKKALQTLIATMRRKYGDIPVYGHRDFANKACPSFDAKSEYNK